MHLSSWVTYLTFYRDKIDSITDTLRGKKRKPKVCETAQDDQVMQVGLDDPLGTKVGHDEPLAPKVGLDGPLIPKSRSGIWMTLSGPKK